MIQYSQNELGISKNCPSKSISRLKHLFCSICSRNSELEKKIGSYQQFMEAFHALLAMLFLIDARSSGLIKLLMANDDMMHLNCVSTRVGLHSTMECCHTIHERSF